MVINTNLAAQSGARLLSESSAQLAKSLSRLSSGSKIISPEDDAAGLAVAMRFDGQIARIGATRSNLNNAVSFSQTQDGYLQKVSKALNRMSELAVLAQDATKSDPDRALYNAEFTKQIAYVSDLATKTFNGVTLFGATGLTVTTDSEGGTQTLSAADLSTATSGAAATTVDSLANAQAAATAVKTAISDVASIRANVGANISMLTSYSDQLGLLNDSLTAANSRIKDVDVAHESAAFAKYNILVQAGTAMLAQANQSPQSVLRLLQ